MSTALSLAASRSDRTIIRLHGPHTEWSCPFPYFAATPCLSADHYQQLVSTFPSPERFAEGSASMDNQVLRRSSSSLLADPAVASVWKEFIEQHTSQRFWHRIAEIFGGHIGRAHPELEARLGRPLHRLKAVRRGSGEEGDLFLECQAVVNTPVHSGALSVKAPHVDHVNKLWTGLLYMRDESDPTPGGHLELYAPISAVKFDKHQAPRQSVIREALHVYSPNSFIGFVNSAQAIHSVSPRAPSAFYRRYVDFVVEFNQPIFRLPQMDPIAKTWFRLRHREESR